MKSNELLKLSGCALLAAIIVSGCRCDDGITTSEAEFAVTPPALNFQACPTKDENGATVPEVFPDEQIFRLQNLGKVSGTVAKFEITSEEAGAFTVAADKKPTVVEGSGEVEVPVRFSPSKRGDVRGTITIDDESDETEPVTVSLIGTGTNLPSQPTVQLAFEAQPGVFQDCDPSVLSSCSPVFQDTFFNETNTVTFKVKNGGCPTLKITGAEIKPTLQQLAAQQAYSFESGFVTPTLENPASLNAADDNSELAFKITFAPVDETTNPSQPDDGQRYAILSLKTNDPTYPSLDIALGGVGVKPSAYASPTFCNFTDLNDRCGNSARIPNKARIAIGNGGQRNITVKSLTFVNGGRSGRFTLTGTPTVGQTIAPGAFAFQEVTFSDQPLFVSDELVIATTDFQNLSQSAGDVKVTFYGGTLPCLSTDPADQLSFANPTDALTVKDVVIKNGASCGTLIIDDVVVDAPNAFFSVVDPKLGAGTQVLPGTQVTAKVQFKKPVSGGSQSGVLRVKTNDPAYGPEPYKVLTLYSQAPVNQLPIAVLKGPTGNEQSYSVSKATIAPTGSPATRKIQLVGTDSYDPPAGAGSVAKYQWFLAQKPNGANGASLEHQGAGKVTQGTALLTIDDVVTGEYRVALKVFDAEDQPSSNFPVIKIFVSP